MPVTEVAERFGVSRQAVHRWLGWYRTLGLDGLADRSHRPNSHPAQTTPEAEAPICELRRTHPNGCPDPIPSVSTIYRVLVRHGLVDATPRRRRREDYRRWQRAGPMELWQLDIVDGIRLADGSETKIVTGVDDHSRFCVIATVVRRATGRAVCTAFAEALREYGVPDEVLTDNGQAVHRPVHPAPSGRGAVRADLPGNGIVARNTKPRTPTTTGKVEPVGYHFAGRRVTVRIDRGLLQLVDNGILLRRLPNPLTAAEVARIRDARPAGPPPQPAAEPQRVERRVSCRGTLAIAGQRIHLGIAHAGRTLTVEAADTTWRVYDGDGLVAEVARTTTRPISRPGTPMIRKTRRSCSGASSAPPSCCSMRRSAGSSDSARPNARSSTSSTGSDRSARAA